MGAPPLPAPTETDTTTPTELTTDISRPGDEKSTYSLPDDGTPVTIRTRGHRANKSQTSLLIEYFEGGKSGSGASGSDRRPSVRVRLTPSKKGKGDHVQLTETKGSRKASLTRRIPLGEAIAARELEGFEGEDAHSMTSYTSATEESNVSRNPVDIEIDHGRRRRRPASPLIPSEQSYQPGNPSEISAIPNDSFLDGDGPASDVKRSFSPSRGERLATAAGAGALAGVAMDQIRNHKTRSKEKSRVSEKSREKSDRERKHRSKSRKSSGGDVPLEEARSPRRRSSRSHQESIVSGADSSVLSSNMSPSHRSMDTHSIRSGTSKSSINNPKLLETVEDAIRRLILPELSALKREQSKRETRRSSLTSTGTSASREDVSTDRRRSSGRVDPTIQTPQRRNREARHNYGGDASPLSVSRDSLNDDYRESEVSATPSRKRDMLKGALVGAAAAKGISAVTEDKSQSERRERRRRRPESSRSRSLGRDRYAEEYEDDLPAPVPPMPLMSDINPSEMTRTSILSADSDRHSASEELLHEVPRGMAAYPEVEQDRSKTPVNLQQSIGLHHANVSHGDLTALPRGANADLSSEYEVDEYGRKLPVMHDNFDANDRPLSDHGDYPEPTYEEQYYSQQEVPPPLKYVPYQAGARGLSPIPSVTEAGSEVHQPRLSMTSDAMPSPEKSPAHPRTSRSMHSLDSIPSNMRSREFEHMSGGVKSPGLDYRNTTYTEDSELDGPNAGQSVRGVAANPNFVHPPSGVESAVASLVDGSMVDQSVLTSGSGNDYSGARDSTLSYEDQSMTKSSRGVSPEKRFLDERHGTPGARSHDQSEEFSEYEIDENGRKVPRAHYRHYPTASEAAITAGAVGAAAAALKKAQEQKQATVQEDLGDDFQPAGVARNKSFKERAMDGWEPRNTPAHSIDRFEDDEMPQMSARAFPDSDHPMPEAAYVDDDLRTNPSVVEERLDGQQLHDEPWSRGATPTPNDASNKLSQPRTTQEGPTTDRGLGITEAAGVAALGAAAGMAAAHSRQASQDDEWHRTSDERKRDTLVTNPYEDASPIANPALHDNLLGARGLGSSYNPGMGTGSPMLGQKYDEGYMSNGPNHTPDRDAVVKGKGVDFASPMNVDGEDPFYVPKNHGRQLSGMSQGMASPFYDAATGAGIDRIENKDIIALMQHLMVRDAQRSARDTEIVALLMNAAVEMRNSFQEMKDLIQETGDDMIFANTENTEKLQKAINGPRPYPGTGARSMHTVSVNAATTTDESNAKSKNLWKRALAGLSAKGTSDLSRIEEMLMQLLGEVDVLKTQTAVPGSNQSGRGASAEPMQPEIQYEADRGYEPEGVSTASHASHSGQLVPQTAVPMSRLTSERRTSENRISTVPENDEEYQYDHPSPAQERSDPAYLTPGQGQGQRGSSVPLDTPPHQGSGSQAALSAENTPRTDKSKKHKSSSSSGWNKFSRWSETTASSVGRAFRGKKSSKYDEYHPGSRSGSSLGSYEDYPAEDQADKLHSGFSEPNLAPSAEPNVRSFTGPQLGPLIPEDPKYKAHRNSLNLQHPQPRPGQTERFRNALEYSAQEFNDPMTPRTAEWAGSATSLNRLPAQNTNRYSNTSSTAARDADYWPTTPGGQAPPRPPKEPMDDPATQTPPRSNRVENRNLNAALGVPSRKPSGPRAMTPKSPEGEALRDERRRKRDTFGTVASNETDTF